MSRSGEKFARPVKPLYLLSDLFQRHRSAKKPLHDSLKRREHDRIKLVLLTLRLEKLSDQMNGDPSDETFRRKLDKITTEWIAVKAEYDTLAAKLHVSPHEEGFWYED